MDVTFPKYLGFEIYVVDRCLGPFRLLKLIKIDWVA